MGITEWFRNTSWNDAIAAQFETRLARARRKEQYLRIQASTLSSTEPEVAHKLFDRYLALPDQFDQAQAHVDRATAFIAQGRFPEAVGSYEAALSRESAFPRLLTQAYLELPYLVATHRLQAQYARAFEILEQHKSRLMFPLDLFKWNAAKALILFALNDRTNGKLFAGAALAASKADSSDFTYHPSVGLVGSAHEHVIKRLEELHDA